MLLRHKTEQLRELKVLLKLPRRTCKAVVVGCP